MAGQGVKTLYKRVKQSGRGVAGSTGSQRIRRVSAEFNKNSNTTQNNEIVDHRQSTGATETTYNTTGTVNGLWSPGTYCPEQANLLLKDFVATSAITGVSLTIAASGSVWTITRSTGSFITDGVKQYDNVRLTAGSFNAANLNKNLWVLDMTAAVLTVIPANDVALVAEGPVTGATVAVTGKKAWVPLTGHTDDYYTWEKYQPDLSTPSSELYIDVKCVSADVEIPAEGNVTINFDLPGLKRVLGTAEVLTSPSAATTTEVLSGTFAKFALNGALLPITSLSFTITGNVQPGAAEIGSRTSSDHQSGILELSGSFSAKYNDQVIQMIRENQSIASFGFLLATNGAATADIVAGAIPAANIFTDTAPDGQTEIIRSYSFTAKLPATGGASAKNHQTIFSLQDSQAP